MKIETNTKYNIGDTVFFIYEDTVNNDYYCTDYHWIIGGIDDFRRSSIPEPSVIKSINIRTSNSETVISYLIQGILFKESDVFNTCDDAIQECHIRNSL